MKTTSMRLIKLVTSLLLGLGLLGWQKGSTSSFIDGWQVPTRPFLTEGSSYTPRLAVETNGKIHLVWIDWIDLGAHPPYILYSTKSEGGAWTSYQTLPGNPYASSIAVAMGQDDTLHITWWYDNAIRYISRSSNGIWSSAETISSTGSLPDVSVAPNGTIHLLWAGFPSDLDPNPSNEYPFWHCSKAPNGGWSAKTLVYKDIHPGNPLIVVDDFNNAYAIMTSTGEGEHAQFAEKLNGQAWSSLVALPFDTVIWTTEQLAVSPTGEVHLIWAEWNDAEQMNQLKYAMKPFGLPWNTPITLAQEYYPIYSALTADTEGQLSVVWNEKDSSHIGYMESLAPGEWSFPSRTEASNSWIGVTSNFSIARSATNVKTIAWDSGPVILPYNQADGRGDLWVTTLSDEPPTSEIITSGVGGTLYSFYKNTGLVFPAGAVITDTLITHTPAGTPPTGLLFPVRIFDLSAENLRNGSPVTSFGETYTLTVSYTHTELQSAIESTLQIYSWNGSQWEVETTDLDMTNNLAVTHPNHMTYFGLMGETNRVYLPVCLK